MKINDILTEGVSPVLYHGTNVIHALDIMSDNQFKLSMVGGTAAEQNFSNKLYYFSATRSVTGSYHQDPYGTSALFKLDGRKLSHNYSGKPVDFWGPEFRALGNNEMEDRIFSDTPYIEDAKKYITEVHLYINSDEVQRDSYKVKIRKIYLNAKLAGIPVYFYEDKKAFNITNKLKTITPTAELLGKGVKTPTFPNRPVRNTLARYVELVHKNDYASLSRDGKYFVDMLLYYPHDAIPAMSADVHNVKSDPQRVDKLVQAWRKLGISTVAEYVALMTDKWKEIN